MELTYALDLEIISEDSSGANLQTASRALLLDFPVVQIDTVDTIFVQTAPHIDWVFVDVKAHGTEKHFLDLSEEV